MTLDLLRDQRRLPQLDPIVELARRSPIALTEKTLLEEIWATGEDVRIHEDERFSRSRHGERWHLREQRLANEVMYNALLRGEWNGLDLQAALRELDRRRGGCPVFDPDDPRFHQVCDGRWTAVLDDLPLRGASSPDAAEVLSLDAAGGRFGGDQSVEPRGFVTLREPPPPGAFVARIVGASMEPRLPHRSFALFIPDGGQGRVVLAVHPEFRDGTLAACTVKNAIRNAQGNIIELRPENPAFLGQPVLPEGALWEDVRPVASLVRPLVPADFVDLVVPGTRQLPRGPLSDADLERRLEGLRGRLERLLRERTRRQNSPPAREDETLEWARPELVLAADGKALRILVPGWPLPDGVRHVTIAGVAIVARNLRREQLTPAVKPQVEDYVFQVPDAPADVALSLSGLSRDRATVFHAPAQGPGTRIDSASLREGRPYRLLVPPGLRGAGEDLLRQAWAEDLGRIDGWTVVQIEVPTEDDAGSDALLGRLGLSRVVVGLEVALVGPGTRRVQRLASGHDAPVYSLTEPPCVSITAAEPCAAGDVHLLVVDANGTSRLALGPGMAWTVELEDLAPGAVLVEARATNRDVEHDQLIFLVEDGAPTPTIVPARAELELGARRLSLLDGVVESLNLRPLVADDSEATARIVGPPLWVYGVSFGRERCDASLEARADEEGVAALPLPELRSLTTRALGQVAVYGAELGSVRLLHEAPPTTDELIASLRALDQGRAVPIRGFAGAHELAREWVLPVLHCLGFEAGGVVVVSGDVVEASLARLYPRDGGGIRREAVGLVRVVSAGKGMLSAVDGSALRDPQSPLGELAARLRQIGLSFGILTDGEQWVRVEPLRYLPRVRVEDLRAALADAFDHRLAEFLDRFVV